MKHYQSKHLCVSSDILVEDDKFEELTNIVTEFFCETQICNVKVRPMPLKTYFNESQNWSSVVIFFGGYNIKRYFHNCWKHLLFFPRPLYGINFEGKLFKLPRFYALKSIVAHELKTYFLRICAKIFSVMGRN